MFQVEFEVNVYFDPVFLKHVVYTYGFSMEISSPEHLSIQANIDYTIRAIFLNSLPFLYSSEGSNIGVTTHFV